MDQLQNEAHERSQKMLQMLQLRSPTIGAKGLIEKAKDYAYVAGNPGTS